MKPFRPFKHSHSTMEQSLDPSGLARRWVAPGALVFLFIAAVFASFTISHASSVPSHTTGRGRGVVTVVSGVSADGTAVEMEETETATTCLPSAPESAG